jgi:Na+/H+-dicarboxylate symporter
MKNLALHWKILIGMVLGVIAGLILSSLGLQTVVSDYIKPFGTIFINMLKLIAIPLILVSLIKGVVDLQDISKFKTLGVSTFLWYVGTTMLSVMIGLIIVNFIRPGSMVSPETIAEISNSFGTVAQTKIESAAKVPSGPLQFLVDMVPDNFFKSASDNTNMLQVIFFAVFFGISLLLVDKKTGAPVINLFNGLNETIMKMVDIIMLTAPFAVFALLCSLVAETNKPDLFVALTWYVFAVLLGLVIMLFIYALFIYFIGKKSPIEFFKAIAPAQLLGFSTSSSAATLPVTMERLEEHLGVEKEITSFVCPLGATINMNGTSLYQAVAAIFICEVSQFDLTFADQMTIIITATLASIGSAAVPGAGMIMLVVVLESLGLPIDKMSLGLALIFAVDRPLDMCRTVINLTGDCMVAFLMAKKFNKLTLPKPKHWDDNYESVA